MSPVNRCESTLYEYNGKRKQASKMSGKIYAFSQFRFSHNERFYSTFARLCGLSAVEFERRVNLNKIIVAV